MLPRILLLLLLVPASRPAHAAAAAPEDPRYQDRRLSSWILSLPDYFDCHPTNCRPFLALGSNAVPFLAWVVGRTNLGPGDVRSVLRVMHANRTVEPSAEMFQSVQARAAFVLEQLGPLARPATPALLTAVREGAGNQRLAAALALAAVSPRQAESVELLDALLAGAPHDVSPSPGSTDPALEIRLAIARVATAPRAGSWERAMAAVGLCQLSEDRDRAARVLSNRWSHQDRGFRLNILQPLTRVLRSEALLVLRAAAADPDASVRRNAAVLVSTLHGDRPTEVTEVLVRAGTDEVPGVRLAALQLLWRIRPNSDPAVDAALRGLGDEDEWVRAAAARWLTGYSGPRLGEVRDQLPPHPASPGTAPK
jgi:hypothetical protein